MGMSPRLAQGESGECGGCQMRQIGDLFDSFAMSSFLLSLRCSGMTVVRLDHSVSVQVVVHKGCFTAPPFVIGLGQRM